MDRATPVERRGLLPVDTGQGSLWSSPSRSVRDMSHLGWKEQEQEEQEEQQEEQEEQQEEQEQQEELEQQKEDMLLLVYRLEELVSRRYRLSARPPSLAWRSLGSYWPAALPQAEHLLHLLRAVVLRAPEHVRPGHERLQLRESR